MRKNFLRIILFVIALAASVPASAQLQYQVTPALTYGAKDTTKKQRDFPVFWSAARKVFPPLPFNPFPDLTVYDAGNNNLIYDDREVNYPALEAAMAKERAQADAEADALEKDAGGGGMAMRSSSSSTNLTLATPVFDGTNLALTIENGVAGEFYDLFYSTNLVDWLFHVRTDIDQFSFSITPPAWPVCFFRLGTQQDTDDDTLTDAYEALITQTSPTFPNTLQNLNLYTNFTPNQISNLTMVLTDLPPVLEMEKYERDYSVVFLNDACAFETVYPFSSSGERTRWTNGVGGFFTNSQVRHYCVNNTMVTTNSQMEGRIAADGLGTNQHRRRVDNGVWSAWTNGGAGVVPSPGGLLNDQSYRRTRFDWTFSFNPLEVYRLTDLTKATLRYRTRGRQFSMVSRMHRITVSAEEFNLDGTSYDVPRYLLRFPGLGNQSADVNGELYVTMEDNATKDVTPSLQHVNLTNYSFNVSAERYLIHLNFRNSGYLTGPEANGDGYEAANYTHLIQYCATNLGVHATIDDGTAAQRGSNWMNLEEIFATVPVSVNLSWEWHQDKQRARYLWRPGDTIVTQTDPLVNFSTQGPGGGNDMPAGNLADSTPDAQGNVYIPDSPSLPLNEPALVNAPVGSVAALRFYGHTWLTANGGFASEILKWRTFITIKKTANGWIRAGANNFISLTPMGVSEDPSFTVQDAIDATGP